MSGEIQDAFRVASSGMKAQATRIRHLSENIANADTPGYRRKVIPFEVSDDQTLDADGLSAVKAGAVSLDRRETQRIFDPSHPLADAEGFYEGSNVDLMIEIADAREAQRGYEANLRMFDQARQMASGLLDLLRR